MVSNFSPKLTKKYIGTKGLGFRSVVLWSNQITINSQNIDICFSKEISSKFYNEICDAATQIEIAEKRNLSNNIKPIAFLAVPEITDNVRDDWTTSINIEYKTEYEDNIKKQINNIQEEILLFVNHIDKLILIVDQQTKIIERIKDNNLIYVNKKLWTIYSKKELLPEKYWDKDSEEEYYELKIALQETFEAKHNFLFSFFPTKIELDFPFIIHGTFDLNSSRNDLNDNPKNSFVLEKLVELIIETAKDLTKVEVSYNALKFLSYSNKNITLNNLNFYNKINDAIEELAIFPCLDNVYRRKSDVVFISDDFSGFIRKTNTQYILPNLIIPHYGVIDIQKYNLPNSIDTDKLNELSSIINDIDDRVELIFLFHKTFIHENQLVFLVDKNNNLVSLDDDVYTPVTKDYSLNIPDFVNIKFINNELYEKLLIKFEINSNEKARDLQRELKTITNIQSYEPAQIIQKIITSTNREIEKENEESIKLTIIKKMILSLYENYKMIGEKTSIPEKTKIQLVSKNNTIENSTNLFLSKTYQSGQLTEELFNNIFDDSYFLANVDQFNFSPQEDIIQIERFFLWLGVNKYTKFKEVTYDSDYEAFIFTKIEKPANFGRLSSFELLKIEFLAEIISYYKDNDQYEKLILWLLSDKKIFSEIIDKKILKYYYRRNHDLPDAPSFVLFQLASSSICKDFLITNEKLSDLVNEISISYNSELFKKYDIKKSDVESLILKIGAVDKFENLSISAVKNIFRRLPLKSPEGKQTLTIYKEALDHYKKNKQPLNDSQIKLCSKKHNELDYYPQSEIYYNGNIKLPKKITDTMAILNLPRRQNTTNIIRFYGINDLKKINITIKKHTTLDYISKEFQKYFKEILPYILVYRFGDSTTESSRKNDIAKIKNVSIQLCSQVEYSLNNNSFELDNNDYIKNGKEYFIKISETKSFNELRRELDFRETFSDIIGSVFDISDIDKFSRLISDDLHDTEEIIKRNVGSDEIILARELLGVSDEKYSFWKTIYSLKNREYDHISDPNLLLKIKYEFSLQTKIEDIDYNNLNEIKNCALIEALFNELELSIKDFNQSNFSYYKLDFLPYHNHKLKQCFNEHFYKFKLLLHRWCKENSKETDFLLLIGKYEHNEIAIEKNEINIDYFEIVRDFIGENFDFTITNNTVESKIDLEQIFQNNKSKIDFEKIEYSNEFRSLLYFENKIEDLKKIIDDLDSEKIDDSSGNASNQSKPIIPVELSKPIQQDQKHIPTKKPHKHSQKKNRQNKDIGDKAEKEVFESLKKEFGIDNVEWVSKDDDSYGYDIRYKSSDGDFKYVEVKTYSNGMFHLSKNQKEFAEKNIGNFEMSSVKRFV